jgi:oxygen-independent coproporphyrinogen-3 oxidase
MTCLRTAAGLSLKHIALQWNNEWVTEIIHDAQPWIQSNHIEYSNNHLRLTEKGKLFADGIAASLFRETL